LTAQGLGHSRSPLEAHRQWLLGLVAAEPDLTLDRVRLKSEKRLTDMVAIVFGFALKEFRKPEFRRVWPVPQR
jgi:hypothetical protein